MPAYSGCAKAATGSRVEERGRTEGVLDFPCMLLSSATVVVVVAA